LIEAVLEHLREKDYLNDRSFAEFWVESRERFNPRGSQALRHELRLKGVEREIVDEAVDGEQDEELARRAAARKAEQLRQAPGMDFNTFRNRLGGFLQRRGFSYGITARIVKELWQEEEE